MGLLKVSKTAHQVSSAEEGGAVKKLTVLKFIICFFIFLYQRAMKPLGS